MTPAAMATRDVATELVAGSTAPARHLAELAAGINHEHAAAQGALHTGLEHARAAGGLLLEARELCPHGAWLPWLAKHFEGSERTARAYMQVAREWERLTEANRQRVADLPYREALRALTTQQLDDIDGQPVADQVDLTGAPRRQVLDLVRAGKDELARRRAEAAHERLQLSAETAPHPLPMCPGFRVFRGDNRAVLPTLAAGSVQLVITSPGHGVGWDYADGGAADSLPLHQHLEQLREVLIALLRVLRPGGVLALNLPETIRTPHERAFPLTAWATLQLREMGYLLREPIVWQHQDTQGRPMAFGTAIGAPTNPYLRRTREHVLLASVGDYRIPGKRTVWPPESIEWTKDTWAIGPGHMLPGGALAFPDELVRRLVELFSEPDDVILDPYAGTGVTGRVSRARGRQAWLIEREPSYWADLEGTGRMTQPAIQSGKQANQTSGLSVYREAMVCCVRGFPDKARTDSIGTSRSRRPHRDVEPEASGQPSWGRRKDHQKLDCRRGSTSSPYTGGALSPCTAGSLRAEETRPRDPAQCADTQGPIATGGSPAAELTLHVDIRRRDDNTRTLSPAKGGVRVLERPN